MKGYRTYQIAIMAFIIFIAVIAKTALPEISILENIKVFLNDITDLTSATGQLLVTITSAYTAYLSFDKIIRPHPMKHEKKDDTF